MLKQLLVFIFALLVNTNSSALALNVRVNTNDDNADSLPDQNRWQRQRKISLGRQSVGTIFRNITIPSTAEITNAYVSFTPLQNAAGTPNPLVTISGEKSANPENFVNRLPPITDLTTAKINWSIPRWKKNTVNANTRTPNIKSIIQEIISLPNWVSGGGINILFSKDRSAYRLARTYKSSPNRAPLLHIEYTLSNAPQVSSITSSCSATNQITIVFDKNVDYTTATSAANYTITGGLSVTSATRNPNNTVTLTLNNNLSNLTEYTLSISNVEDTSGNAITMAINKTFTHSCTCIFKDNFSASSYNNNDGSKQWSGSWTEINDNGNPFSGDIYITGGNLVMTNTNRSVPSIYRQLDLTGATSATLDFAFTTTAGVDKNQDKVEIHVSSDGGSNWALLEQIKDIDGAQTVTKSYDITSYISANTQIKISITNSGYKDNNEKIRFAYVAVTPAGLCSGTLDHFNIDIGGASASTCSTKNIIISARDSSNAILTDYTGSPNITSSTSHGNFSIISGNGTLAPSPDNDDNGAASYTFTTVDSGQITLGLTNEHADNLTITVNDAAKTVSTTSNIINFRDNAFVITKTNSTDPEVAGKPLAMTATLVKRESGVCEMATAFTGDKELKVSIARTAELPNSLEPTINGISIPNIQPATSNINLTFANGVTRFDLDTTDVGQYALTLLDDSQSFATGIDISGSSSTITSRPFGFDIDFNDDRAINDTSGNSHSIDGDSNISRFAYAGEDVDMQLTAVLWGSDDDLNLDGIPDTNANLTDNNSTPSFGKESSAPSITYTYALNEVMVDGELTVANSASTGNISPASSITLPYNNTEFTNGATTATTLNWSEVGIIDINASLSNYLGNVGSNITGSVTNVGRFVPHSFTVTVANDGAFANTITDATGFTYIGQNFGYSTEPQFTITAKNIAGNTTKNYGNTFNKLDLSKITLKYPTQDNNKNDSTENKIGITTIVDTSTHTLTPNNNNTGTLSLTLNSDQFRYERTNAKVSPFTAALDISLTAINETTDEATYDGTATNGTATAKPTRNLNRYGRAFLSEAFAVSAPYVEGATTNSFVKPYLRVEYFDGDNFVSNTDDSSTTISDSDLTCTVAHGNLTCSGELDGTDDDVSITSATITPNDSFIITNTDTTGLKAGSLTITTNYPNYLRYDWDENDTLDDEDSTSTIGFYIGRGDDRFLYWNEVEKP